MSTVSSVRDSRKDLISVDSEKCDQSTAGSNGGDSGDMTTFNRSRSNRLLIGALVLSIALCVGLLIGLIVVSSKTPPSKPTDYSAKSEANKAEHAGGNIHEDMCLTEGCIGMVYSFYYNNYKIKTKITFYQRLFRYQNILKIKIFK